MRMPLPALTAGAALLLSSAIAATPAAATGKSSDTKGAGPEFLPIPEITAPIFGESRIEGALSVTLVVQATDARAAAALKNQLPQLRTQALIATLEFSRLYASGYSAVDARRFSTMLNAALRPGHPQIARVLIVKLGAVPA